MRLRVTGGTGPFVWSVKSGHLSSGLELGGLSGEISGVPGQAGSKQIVVRVAESAAPSKAATGRVTIDIAPHLSISSNPLLPEAMAGERVYSVSLDAVAGTRPYHWKVVKGLLPPGLALNPDGVIVGSPAKAGTAHFVVQVNDHSHQVETASASFTLPVGGWRVAHSLDTSLPVNDLGAVSCTAPTDCIAVGTASSVAFGRTCPSGLVPAPGCAPEGYAERFNGKNWSLVPAKAPPAEAPYAASMWAFIGVSCLRRNSCFAVGNQSGVTPSGFIWTRTLIEHFGGTSWSIAPSPNGNPPFNVHTETGSMVNDLVAVSCPSSKFCMAVGRARIAPTTSYKARPYLAEEWNGQSWSLLPVPPPTRAFGGDQFTAVSCVSSTFCVAAGTSLATWNGKHWSVVATATTAFSLAAFTGVSCTSRTFCMATGVGGPGGSGSSAFYYELNGHKWSEKTMPKGVGVTAVSCGSDHLCVGATGAGCIDSMACPVTGQKALTGYFDGSTWSMLSSPAAPGVQSQLNGISCVGADCVAAGSYSSSPTGFDSAPGGSLIEEMRVGDLAIMSSSLLPAATRQRRYYDVLLAEGGNKPYSWSLVSGRLPSGLHLSKAGVISGVPAATGTSRFVVKVTDSSLPRETNVEAVVLVVGPPLRIATGSLPVGHVGKLYVHSVVATGGSKPYAWSLVAGHLPPGLSLLQSTGVIWGRPSRAASVTLKVKVADDSGHYVTKKLRLTVK